MSDEARELDSLRAISAEPRSVVEGGVLCILLSSSRLVTAGGLEVMDIVLCPKGQGGYVTRLLIERQVRTTAPLNWQTVVVLGRTWSTWSWNQIPAGQPWLRILAEHARLLR